MNIGTILNQIMQGLARDDALTSWCMTNYDKAQTVYHPDERDLPTKDNCPYIHLKRLDDSADEEMQVITIGMLTALYDEAVKIRTDPNVEDWEGSSKLDDFVDRIKAALKGIDFGEGRVSQYAADYENPGEEDTFPYHVVRIGIILESYRSMGDNPLD